MPNEFKTPEEYVSDALDLMIKAGWAKQHHQSVEGLGVDFTQALKAAPPDQIRKAVPMVHTRRSAILTETFGCSRKS
jgi:hypothetical protein